MTVWKASKSVWDAWSNECQSGSANTVLTHSSVAIRGFAVLKLHSMDGNDKVSALTKVFLAS